MTAPKQLKRRAWPKITLRKHALFDKLSKEHPEVLSATEASAKCEELADLIEVAFALARQYGATEDERMALVRKKRSERASFAEGFYDRGEQPSSGAR